MPSYKAQMRENLPCLSVGLFILLFACIQYIKPSCFYNANGSIREFGIGYKNKTIFPIWIFSLSLGIVCYLALLYCIQYG